jgi:hypothetical protein
MIINGIQAAALEHNDMRTTPWNREISKRDLTVCLLYLLTIL